MSNEAFDRAVQKVHDDRAAEAARKAAAEKAEQDAKTQLENEGPVWAKKFFDLFKAPVLTSVASHPNTFSVIDDTENSFGIDIEHVWQLKVGLSDRTLTIITLDADKPENKDVLTAPRYTSLECVYIPEQGWQWKRGTAMGNNRYSIGDMTINRPVDNSQLLNLFMARLTELMSMRKQG